MSLEHHNPNDSTKVTDSKAVNPEVSNQAYQDRADYLKPFNGNSNSCAGLHDLEIVDSTHPAGVRPGSTEREGEYPYLWLGTEAIQKADIWGKDHMVTMGELSTKMRSEGVSAEDMKKLGGLAQNLERNPREENWKAAEEIGRMAEKWTRGKDCDQSAMEELGRLYVEFKQVARLDGDGNSVSSQDLLLNNKLVDQAQHQQSAPARPAD